jgi:pantoate--beta-alanine ligase
LIAGLCIGGNINLIESDCMEVIGTLSGLRQALGQHPGCSLVPTMGNLHDGHLALVRQAQEHGLPVVVSIFVNRLQFGPHEDFDRYPRTLAQDIERLKHVGCDYVFAPSEAELYPKPQTCKVHPDPALADILEGHFRPGFFIGVCTVVLKLFACVQPKVAVFGQKDYQQWLIIRHMVQQLAWPVHIAGAPTLRAPDGLALSSRNAYLSSIERLEATRLHATLWALSQRVLENFNQLEQAEADAMAELTRQGWAPDYLCVRRRSDLQRPGPQDHPGQLVALGAARLGQTRLIDNVEF